MYYHNNKIIQCVKNHVNYVNITVIYDDIGCLLYIYTLKKILSTKNMNLVWNSKIMKVAWSEK